MRRARARLEVEGEVEGEGGEEGPVGVAVVTEAVDEDELGFGRGFSLVGLLAGSR